MNSSPILGWLVLTNYRSPVREQVSISAAWITVTLPSTQPFLQPYIVPTLCLGWILCLCVSVCLYCDEMLHFTAFHLCVSMQFWLCICGAANLGGSRYENVLMISVGLSLTSPWVHAWMKPSDKLHTHTHLANIQITVHLNRVSSFYAHLPPLMPLLLSLHLCLISLSSHCLSSLFL